MANDIVAVMEKGENADLVKDQFAGMFVEVWFRWLRTWRSYSKQIGLICPNSWIFMISAGEYDLKIISVTF